ncbi:MAG: type IV pilus secretin PilQ [Elusimicrobia bacterium]|nr:type IV pilus secretin PilQ [Elusimicrobiota bacterium]
MRTMSTKAAATLLALCLAWPQGLVFAAASPEPQGEIDALLKASKPKVVVFDGVEVSEDRVMLKLSGKVKHQTQLLDDPPRLLVDLYGTDYQVGVKSIPGKGPRIKGVRGAQFKGAPDMVSRVVVELSEKVPYRVALEGDNLVLALLSEGAIPTEPQGAAVPEPASAPAVAAAAPAEEKDEPAKPAEAEVPVAAAPVVAARPTVAVPKAQPKPQPKAQPKPVVAAMPPLQSVPASRPAAATRAPAPKAAAKCRSQQGTDILSRLPCDPVDLDFDNTPIKDILTLLSAKTQVNIISGPEVAGNLTLHLKGVPFDEAFRTILSMTGLTTIQVGENILRVLTPTSLTQVQANATTMTKVVTLRYSKASEILPALTSVRAAEGRTKGNAIVDEKSNSLIITDSIEGMASMERLIQRLDEVPKQVLIEAKIVEVNLNDQVDFGIKWDIYKAQTGSFLGQKGLTMIGSRVEQTTDLTSQNMVTTVQRENATPTRQPADGSLTGVDLLPSGPVGMLTIGRVTNNYFLNMQLGAAAQQGRLKVLSDPKIATLNNKAAEINVTDQIPYDVSQLSANGTVSRNIQFIAMGITLKVTPIISADETRITLDINPEVSKPSGTSGSVSGAPSTSRSTVKTIVIVRDAETVVIGGLITDRKDTRINKVPLLGDIPVLGWLFKKKFDQRQRVELLIFVTPRIIKDT